MNIHYYQIGGKCMNLFPSKDAKDKDFSRYVCTKCKKVYRERRLFCSDCRGPFIIKIKTIIK